MDTKGNFIHVFGMRLEHAKRSLADLRSLQDPSALGGDAEAEREMRTTERFVREGLERLEELAQVRENRWVDYQAGPGGAWIGPAKAENARYQASLQGEGEMGRAVLAVSAREADALAFAEIIQRARDVDSKFESLCESMARLRMYARASTFSVLDEQLGERWQTTLDCRSMHASMLQELTACAAASATE